MPTRAKNGINAIKEHPLMMSIMGKKIGGRKRERLRGAATCVDDRELEKTRLVLR